uniref:NAD(P)-binding domain-containing protein n=1 Tax=Solanum lycopersicum TaxID=4081 RepID=A0A3Q7IDC0_SOLLC|nr:cinnamoyl-CoA reductase 1 [Solanum lycopersicum]
MAPTSPLCCISNTVYVMGSSTKFVSSLIIRLLEKGFTVHAAIQNHGDESELISKCDKKRLKAFCLDLFDYHSIIDALKGCCCLFYSFEPPKDHSATYDLWYALSKTLAERTAWGLAMDRGIKMVSINSGLLMDDDLNIKNPYLKGAKEMYENGVLVSVDVDFLVYAHICVYEDVSSYGRYLCFNHIINTINDAINLANNFNISPLPSPPPSFEKDTKIIQQRISNKKLNKIMIKKIDDI